MALPALLARPELTEIEIPRTFANTNNTKGYLAKVPHGDTGKQFSEMKTCAYLQVITSAPQISSSFNQLIKTLNYSEDFEHSLVQSIYAYTTSEKEKEVFTKKLVNLLSQEPVEENISHPAEKFIEDALNQNRITVGYWIYTLIINSLNSNPYLVSNLLLCMNHLDRKLIYPYGYFGVIAALNSSDLEVRDAAVSALEMWGGNDAKNILKTYIQREPVKWLSDYATTVLNDLTEAK